MKIKNGIIIDGVLHEGIYETVSCSDCSMEDICIKLKDIDTMCCILNCHGCHGYRFTNKPVKK